MKNPFLIFKKKSDAGASEKEVLEQMEMTFRQLAETIKETFWISDADTKQIVYINPACEKMFGVSCKSLYANPMSFLETVHPDDKEALIKTQKDLFSSENEFNEEYRIIKPDGTVRWINTRIYPVKDKKGKISKYAGIAEDITERKKIEADLRESEDKFRKAFFTSPDAVNINRLDDGMYVSVNIGFTRLTGYTAEEIIGKTSAEIKIWHNMDDRARLVDGLKKDGTVSNLEARFVTKSGTIVYGLMSASVIELKGVPHILSITREFTDRIQAEMMIKEHILSLTMPFDDPTDVSFSTLFNMESIQNIQDTFAQAFDVASIITKPDGTPITKPSNFCRLCNDIIRKTEKGLENCMYSDSVIGRQNTDGPITMPCLSGGLIDAGASITVGGKHIANWLIGQVRNEETDIEKISSYADVIGVDKKEFLKALLETPFMSNEKFKKVVDVLFLLANELSVKAYQNIQQARVISRLRSTEDELLHNEKKLKEQNEEYLALNEELTESNHRIAQMNMELIVSKEKAEESDQLKSAFLANMSHEIRTPMNGIIGFSEMISQPDVSNEKRKNYAGIINSSCNRLLSIISDLVDISRIETNQMKIIESPVLINQLLKKLESDFNKQLSNKKIKLKVCYGIENPLLSIVTDETKLNQILQNLIGNAIKFTHNGTVEFGYAVKGHFLEFYIRDMGIGIKPENLIIIFDRFRQVETGKARNYGGTGLGLSISKSFTELMGGKIWVESTFGEGSVFYFTIPYTPVKENIKITTTPTDSSLYLHNKTILIAEDEEFNFLYMQELFQGTGANIEHANNGQEAIDICNTKAIDLVLMDIKMPIKDGVEATILIKSVYPQLPVIAVTAYALRGEKEKYMEAGFNDYLAKPIKKEDLMQSVMQHLHNPRQ